jgi:ATP-dependent RNA helicase DeaD
MNNSISYALGEQTNPLADISLEQLPAPLREAAARAGWTSLVSVQARALPYLLAGRNMMLQARTGSGKTGDPVR